MLHLFSIEILKLQRNRPFLVLISLFVLSVFGVNYLAMEFANTFKDALNSNVFSFPLVWKHIAYISSFLLVIPALIIIMLTCSEYTYRTNRQNIIDGLSRNQYVTTKILFVIALALLSTILTFLSAFIIGLSSDSAVSFTNFRYIYYFFVQALMYISLAFLFALLLKKSALSIGIFLIYSLIFENILQYKFFNKLNVGDLLPLSSSKQLLAPSVLNMVTDNIKPEIVYVLVSITYIAICYAICYYKYEKQDL